MKSRDHNGRSVRCPGGRSGQVLAEYTILMWFFTLIGAATLATFIFAVEEGVVGLYSDIVNVICLPIP